MRCLYFEFPFCFHPIWLYQNSKFSFLLYFAGTRNPCGIHRAIHMYVDMRGIHFLLLSHNDILSPTVYRVSPTFGTCRFLYSSILPALSKWKERNIWFCVFERQEKKNHRIEISNFVEHTHSVLCAFNLFLAECACPNNFKYIRAKWACIFGFSILCIMLCHNDNFVCLKYQSRGAWKREATKKKASMYSQPELYL